MNTYKATCYECGGEVNPIAKTCPSCGAPLPFGPQLPTNFHVARQRKRFGPYTEVAARNSLAQGTIRPDDLCWQPGMATWLPVSRVLQPRRTTDTQRELRERIEREIPPYESLTDSEKETLLKITDYAAVPQPVDYGLTYDETCHSLRAGGRFNAWLPQGGLTGLRYKDGKWVRFRDYWGVALAIFLPLYFVGFVGFVALNPNIPGGWVLDNPRAIGLFFLGMLVPGWILWGISYTIAEHRVERRKQENPSKNLSAFWNALRLHKLHVTARGEVEEAARKAARDAELRKRSYWAFLNGYEFERATAEVLRKHQFTAMVTPGSADGGIDIEVTRNGLKGVVQCKAHVACVGPHVVRDLYGVIHHCGASFGIIVSRGGFTRGAHDFRRDKPILFLDTDDLIAMQEGRDVLAEAFTPKERQTHH